MAINIKSTKEITLDGVKILVYGESGAGKTTLIKTLPRPIVLSAESGLLSLRKFDVPYEVVDSLEKLQEMYNWLISDEGRSKEYLTICLDSISEIGEVVLTAAKKKTKDGRQAYGELSDVMGELIRAFRDIPGYNVYFSAKMERIQDDTGKIHYAPSMPGNKVGQSLPYYFDEVLALRTEKDPEGKTVRALMTDTDGLWTAKDRSGSLDLWEAPDLGAILEKIKGEK